MEQPTVRAITIAQAFNAPEFPALADEYAEESLRNPGLIGVPPDRDAYERLVDAGLLTVLGVFVGNALVGFCAVLVTPVPHYVGKNLASTETLFVAKAYRASGAGLKLLRAAEAVARDAGAGGLYVSAPTGGVLERVLPGVGYHETNRVFLREFCV